MIQVFLVKSIATACLGAIVLTGCANSPRPNAADPILDGQPGSRLYDRVVTHFAVHSDTNLEQVEHHFAYSDLNNDGELDVVVLLTDNSWCFGDSCTAMVFAGRNDAVELVSKLTLVNGPIALGEFVDSGWRDLYVRLPGRSRLTMAKVSHDGAEYPNSPSKWGIEPVRDVAPGRLLISGTGEYQDVYAKPVIDTGIRPSLAETSTTNAESMAALLAEADELLDGEESSEPAQQIAPTTPVVSAASTDGSRTQRFNGRYSWGPGEAFFRPCGGSSLYWVEANTSVFSDLDTRYRQIATLQYDEVFAVVDAQRLPPAAEGSGSFYDGVLMVERVETMEPLDGESCSRP